MEPIDLTHEVPGTVGETPMLRRYYLFSNDELRWAVVGPRGAIDAHCSARDFRQGGVETHGRAPLYADHCQPDRDDCGLLGGNCWHDGSSSPWSGFRLRVAESFREGRTDAIWCDLQEWYRVKFGESVDVNWSVPPEPFPAVARPTPAPARATVPVRCDLGDETVKLSEAIWQLRVERNMTGEALETVLQAAERVANGVQVDIRRGFQEDTTFVSPVAGNPFALQPGGVLRGVVIQESPQ